MVYRIGEIDNETGLVEMAERGLGGQGASNDYNYPVYDASGDMDGDATFGWITGIPDAADTDNCAYVDMCLLYSLGYFESFPNSAAAIADGGPAAPNDNCDAGTACVAPNICDTTAHYVWYWNDTTEKVISVCVGGDCTSNTADGYQDTWP